MFSRKLIHCITALTVAMSSLAPSISQAIAVASDAQGLTMEICIADGSKLAIDLQTDGKSEVMLDCPYCVAQTPLAIPLLTDLQFQAPISFVVIPPLYFQSPKPLFAWVKLPPTLRLTILNSCVVDTSSSNRFLYHHLIMIRNEYERIAYFYTDHRCSC